MFYTVGVTLSAFLGILLITKKQKHISDFILATWLFVIAFHLFTYKLLIAKAFHHFPYLLGLERPIGLLHGVFIYLYTLSLTFPERISKKTILHFTVFIVGVFLILPFLLLSSERKIFVYQNNGIGYEMIMLLFLLGTIVSGIVYSILSFKVLLMHKQRINNNFSNTEKVNLQWLSNLLIGISCIWLFVIYGNDTLLFSAVILYVLYIGFFGIKQMGIFSSKDIYADELVYPISDKPLKEAESYRGSRFSSQQLATIYTQLQALMSLEKLYLTPEITLSSIAKHLDVHPNTLSEVINRMEQKNFFDYINTLRVEEFKKRVHQPENQQFTLLSLAYDCGFNSKTSFNRNFKNITGKSPSEYLRESNIAFN